MLNFSYILKGLIVISIILFYGNIYWESPFITLVSRWVRWILFSLMIAYFLSTWELVDRPYFVLVATALLLWLFAESVSTWFSIRMLAYSSIPLFPRFRENKRVSWPNRKRFIELREWLRANNFKEVQTLTASIADIVSIESVVYVDLTRKTFLQFLLIPGTRGRIAVYSVLMSCADDGCRIITDNIGMPLGGFIPGNWIMVRKPLCRSFKKLFEYHRKSIETANKKVIAWEGEAVDEINYQRSTLEYFNIQKGFLFSTNFHETHGKITSEGKYRLWKKYLLFRYLGIA